MGDGGVEVNGDTTLDADLTCAQGPALVIVADGVVLDLGGHTVSGAFGGVTEGPGILLRNASRCTVRNGTVTRFDAGVAIQGGAGNVVEAMTVEDNIGTLDSDFGDGIVINDSRENVVRGNLVRRNGPFSGISLGPRASANEIVDNTVTDNNMAHVPFPEAGRQTIVVQHATHAAGAQRRARQRGRREHLLCIALDGLPLRATGNRAVGNRAHGNGEFDGSDGTLMPPCSRNVWEDNDFGTVNQPCVSRRSGET